jgi:hypothetical protein
MDSGTLPRRSGALDALLAGLEAGMLGACCLLVWLGVSAKWARRSFWADENLMASVFYGERAVRAGFGAETLSGIALYLLIYSSFGALVALAVANRLPRLRTVLLTVAVAVGWYYLSFRVLWKSAMPLVALLHTEQPMMLGHVLYGTVLGKYPSYLVIPRYAPPPQPSNSG